MLKLNELLVEVSGAQTPIDHELEIGEEITLTITAEVTSERKESNHDGTYNKIYRVKGTHANKRNNTQ